MWRELAMNTDGIIYIPQFDTYRIKVGKTIVEVEAWALSQAWNISQIESILRGCSDSTKNYFLDTILNSGGRLLHDPLDDVKTNNNEKLHSSAWDSLARKLEQDDIIDALYRGPIDPRDTVVACMDLPKPTPYYDPSAAPTIYYNDRFPSVPPMTIIEEALELLNSKKHLSIENIELSKVADSTIRLTLSSVVAAKIPGYKRVLSVWIDYKAFDRAYNMETDRDAGLTARLDTDTYIKLRLAFLINQALKRAETLALATVLDVFKVIGSFDR